MPLDTLALLDGLPNLTLNKIASEDYFKPDEVRMVGEIKVNFQMANWAYVVLLKRQARDGQDVSV